MQAFIQTKYRIIDRIGEVLMWILKYRNKIENKSKSWKFTCNPQTIMLHEYFLTSSIHLPANQYLHCIYGCLSQLNFVTLKNIKFESILSLKREMQQYLSDEISHETKHTSIANVENIFRLFVVISQMGFLWSVCCHKVAKGLSYTSAL